MLKFLYTILSVVILSVSLTGQHNFLNYSIGEGLSHSNVSCIAEDQYGRLYFGTQGGGISRFDGEKFVRFNRLNGLPNDFITSMVKDHVGKIWIGTKSGLAYLENGQCKQIVSASGVEPNILSLAVDVNQVYIGTSNGLLIYNFANRTIRSVLVNQLIGVKIKSLLIREDNTFLGTSKGLFVLTSNDNLQLVTDDLNASQFDVTNLQDLGDHGIALSTVQNGLQVFNEGEFSTEINGLNKVIREVGSLLSDGDELWIGTSSNGIVKANLVESSLNIIDETSGLTSNQITSLYKDSWGNVWIGTEGQGVSKYLGKQFVKHDHTAGFEAKSIHGLLADNNKLWVSFDQGGLATWNIDSADWMTKDLAYPELYINRIFKDQHQLIWLGTTEGLLLSVNDSLIQHRIEDGLSSNNIQSFAIDSNQTIWVGTQGGGICTIEKVDSTNYDIIPYMTGPEWSNTTISDFHIDLRNRTWFCSKDGRLGYFDQNGLQKIFGVPEGLPPIPFHSIAEDLSGQLLLATEGEGLYSTLLYDDSIHFSPVDRTSFRSLNMYSLIVDDKGFIWTTTEEALYKFRLDATGTSNLEFYDRLKGFAGGQIRPNAVARDASGNLWFGGEAGLIQHAPNPSTSNPIIPKIHFTRISIFDSSLAMTSHPEVFNPGENNFNFEFEGFQINYPDALRYRWRLKGYHNSWTTGNKSQFVSFPKLPAGSYQFEVKACIDEILCSNPINYSFSIAKPFWRTWWFFGLALAGFLSIVVISYKRRIRNLLERQRKIEMERQFAILEQKALQLQMNPHFLFNALNSIQGLIAIGDQSEARVQIGKFAKLMRATLTNSQDELISLDQELQTLKWYIEMEQFCRNQSFTFALEGSEEIDLEAIMIPPMIIQPFVENAIIHGLSGISYPGKLTIGIELLRELLVVNIEDNGSGIPAKHPNETDNTNHRSIGIEVTRERLKMMSTKEVTGDISFYDLRVEHKKGTRVKIKIPI